MEPKVLMADEVVGVVNTLEAVESRVEQALTGIECGIGMEKRIVLVGMDPHLPVLMAKELLL